MHELAETDPALVRYPSERGGPKRCPLMQRLHFFLFFSDVLALVILGFGLFLALLYPEDAEKASSYAVVVAVAAIVFASYAFTSDFYDWRRVRETAARPLVAFRAAVFSFGALLLLAFLLKETGSFSRLWGLSWILSFFGYILISRATLTAYIREAARRGAYVRKAVILGAGEIGREVVRHIHRFDDRSVQVVGFLDDRADRIAPAVRGVPVLGRTDMAERLVRQEGVDLVILALPWSAQQRIAQLVGRLSVWAADIYMAPDKLGLEYADRPMFRMAGMNMLSLKDRPISEWSAVIKRVEDLAIAIPALILLSPLMVLTALAIKIDSKGPVFFRQDRYGFSNELIKVFKFRSMYTDMTDAAASRLTTRDDPRVTRVGRFIRRTNIDELPQLFNVIGGSMSIVGPRPHALQAKADNELYDSVVADYASRHRVKPGITGWAQCNGWRGDTDTKEKLVRRVEHDLYYIENWGLFLDAVVIWKTVVQIVRGDRNAY